MEAQQVRTNETLMERREFPVQVHDDYLDIISGPIHRGEKVVRCYVDPFLDIRANIMPKQRLLDAFIGDHLRGNEVIPPVDGYVLFLNEDAVADDIYRACKDPFVSDTAAGYVEFFKENKDSTSDQVKDMARLMLQGVAQAVEDTVNGVDRDTHGVCEFLAERLAGPVNFSMDPNFKMANLPTRKGVVIAGTMEVHGSVKLIVSLTRKVNGKDVSNNYTKAIKDTRHETIATGISDILKGFKYDN